MILFLIQNVHLFVTNDISGCVVFGAVEFVPFDVEFLFSIILYLDVRVCAFQFICKDRKLYTNNPQLISIPTVHYNISLYVVRPPQ